MPGAIRPCKKALKIFNTLMKVRPEQQQKLDKKPTERQLREWRVDNYNNQNARI